MSDLIKEIENKETILDELNKSLGTNSNPSVEYLWSQNHMD